MIKFEIKQAEFTDIIKKMAVPVIYHSRKPRVQKPHNQKTHSSAFLFPTIALTIRPENEIEWIGQSQYITVWIRVKCSISADILEPVQVPIDVKELLKLLKIIEVSKILKASKHSKNEDIISVLYDPTKNETSLTIQKEKKSIIATLPATPKSAVQGMLEKLPFRLEEDTGIILFKNGLMKPNISGSCDVEILQDLTKGIKFVKKELQRKNDKALNKKESAMPLMYNIYVNDDCHEIKTLVGMCKCEYSKTNCMNKDVNGHGELHYLSGFADVVNVLSGKIKFYAVDKGPLWIMQDTDQMKLRYLIAPAPVYIY